MSHEFEDARAGFIASVVVIDVPLLFIALSMVAILAGGAAPFQLNNRGDIAS